MAMQILTRRETNNYGAAMPPGMGYIYNLGNAHGHPAAKDANEFAKRLYRLGVLDDEPIGLFCFTNEIQRHERKILGELGFVQHLDPKVGKSGYMRSHSISAEDLRKAIEERVDIEGLKDLEKKAKELSQKLADLVINESSDDFVFHSALKVGDLAFRSMYNVWNNVWGTNTHVKSAFAENVRQCFDRLITSPWSDTNNVCVTRIREKADEPQSSWYYYGGVRYDYLQLVPGEPPFWNDSRKSYDYSAQGYRGYWLRLPPSVTEDMLIEFERFRSELH